MYLPKRDEYVVLDPDGYLYQSQIETDTPGIVLPPPSVNLLDLHSHLFKSQPRLKQGRSRWQILFCLVDVPVHNCLVLPADAHVVRALIETMGMPREGLLTSQSLN